MEREAELRRLAEQMGCAGFGVTTTDEFDGVADTIRDRQRSGRAGKLRFTYKDPDAAADVRRSFPWALRLVVASWPYLPEAGNPGPPRPGSGRVARFAASDHYRGLRRALDAVADRLRRAGWRAEVVVDDDRLVDRAAAVRAGVGWWGKSTMVLDPRHGPWLLLGAVATDAELATTGPMLRNCGSCDACIPACPTNAILAPGLLDASRCLAHWTQVRGVIPRELRIPMGDRIYGCDECLDVCPPGVKRLALASAESGRVDLMGLLGASDATLLRRYTHFYLPGRSPRYLRRNALVALGNSTAEAATAAAGDTAMKTEAIAVLGGYLGSPDELYRIHAGWALGRIGGPAAAELLRYQLPRERSPAARRDIGATVREIGG